MEHIHVPMAEPKLLMNRRWHIRVCKICRCLYLVIPGEKKVNG